MPDIRMHIGEKVVSGWTSVAINRSIEQVAHSVSLGYHTDANANDLTTFPFELGAPFSVSSNGITVVDGYLDDVDIDLGESEYNVSITARSRGGQIVDSSAYNGAGAWRNKKVDKIIAALLEGYDIELEVPIGVDLGDTFRKFSLNFGESVFSACDRAAKERGLLLIPNEGSGLTLAKATELPPLGTLHAMADVLAESRKGRFTDRFQFYLIRGKHPGKGDIFGADLPSRVFREIDEGVALHRLKILSGNGKKKQLENTVKWERNVRAGRSRRFFVDIKGWHKFDGSLWVPNEMVHYRQPLLYADSPLLISSVSYKLAEDKGDTARLELVRREAFDTIPPTARLKRTKPPPDDHWSTLLYQGNAEEAKIAYDKWLATLLGPETDW